MSQEHTPISLQKSDTSSNEPAVSHTKEPRNNGSKPKWFRILLYFLGTTLALLGLLFLLTANDAKKVHQNILKTWQKTEATIQKSEVDVRSSDSQYIPKLSYSYTVDGKQYENDDYSTNSLYNGYTEKSEAEAIVNKLKVGSKTEVMYDPKEPQKSALETTYDTFNDVLSFMGWSSLVGGLILLIFARRIAA